MKILKDLNNKIYIMKHQEFYDYLKRIEAFNRKQKGVKGAFPGATVMMKVFNIPKKKSRNHALIYNKLVSLIK